MNNEEIILNHCINYCDDIDDVLYHALPIIGAHYLLKNINKKLINKMLLKNGPINLKSLINCKEKIANIEELAKFYKRIVKKII